MKFWNLSSQVWPIFWPWLLTFVGDTIGELTSDPLSLTIFLQPLPQCTWVLVLRLLCRSTHWVWALKYCFLFNWLLYSVMASLCYQEKFVVALLFFFPFFLLDRDVVKKKREKKRKTKKERIKKNLTLCLIL